VQPRAVPVRRATEKVRDASAAWAAYAERAATHAGACRRIDAIAKVGDKLKVLDLTDATVRAAVAEAADAGSLYQGPHASDY